VKKNLKNLMARLNDLTHNLHATEPDVEQLRDQAIEITDIIKEVILILETQEKTQ